MTALVDLLAEARRRGLVLRVERDGVLRVRRPPDAAALARALLDRKADVAPLVPFYAGLVDAVDWRDRRHSARVDGPCVICGKRTMLVDPDGRHCHKTCFEDAVTNAAPAAAGGAA